MTTMTAVAAWVLTACGIALAVVGAFFLTVRPPLLPEDARFIGSSIERIVDAVPGLATWLRRVFWVLGGYILTAGVLMVYVANTGLRSGRADSIVVLAVAGVTSLGWMSTVNFMIRSDFRWALLALDGLYLIGVLTAAAAR